MEVKLRTSFRLRQDRHAWRVRGLTRSSECQMSAHTWFRLREGRVLELEAFGISVNLLVGEMRSLVVLRQRLGSKDAEQSIACAYYRE